MNLATGVGLGGFAEGDRLRNVENLVGSKFADMLIGNAGNNILNGGVGDDVLAGGLGVDQLIGGTGIDLADYSASSAFVTINMANGSNVGGDADGDTFNSIEGVIGTKFADILSGDTLANRFYAGAGDRKSTRLNSSHSTLSRMPSSA